MRDAVNLTRLAAATIASFCITSAACLWGARIQDKVTRVVDGDTVILGQLGRARLIGVDAPESVRPDYPVEYFGREAADFARKSLDGREVTVGFGEERTDSHDRQLVYLYLPDGTLFNAQLIKRGYAFAYTRFPFKFKSQFLAYEDTARHTGQGMWAGSGWSKSGWVFHGNRGSRVYHSPRCEHYNCANCAVVLESRGKAEAKGFRPHERCVLSVH